MNQLKDFFNSEEDWENYIQSFNVRKIINPYDKSWIQKIKRHYKNFGWEMNLYEDQKKRLDMIKQELESF